MTVSGEIIKVLDDLGKRLGVAVDWSSATVIPYLQDLCSRFINYKIAVSSIWMGLMLIIAAIVLTLLHKNKEFGITRYRTIEDDHGGRIVAYIFGVGLPAVFLIINVFIIIKCVFIPETIVIDELISMYNML